MIFSDRLGGDCLDSFCHKGLLDRWQPFFRLENHQELSQSLLMEAALTVSPPVVLDGSCDSNHNGGGLFCDFGCFFVFDSLMI